MYAIIFHAHQKLDRAAHRNLRRLLPDVFFPTAGQIIHFEGHHGPDNANLKRQGSGGQQPWHFVDPEDSRDTQLHAQIQGHYDELVKALKKQDTVRSSFEAAWLAHALVDGLTPAHHYPYEEELARLRGDEDRNTRKGLAGRLYIQADTVRESVLRSLQLIGPKGLLTTHALFEAGAYTAIAPMRFSKAVPKSTECERVLEEGVVAVFKDYAKAVGRFKLYDRFYESGWSKTLSRDIRRQLAPRMVKMVTLAWFAACQEAAS